MSNFIENICDDDPLSLEKFRSTVRKLRTPLNQVRKKTVWEDEALDNLLDSLTAAGRHKAHVPWRLL